MNKFEFGDPEVLIGLMEVTAENNIAPSPSWWDTFTGIAGTVYSIPTAVYSGLYSMYGAAFGPGPEQLGAGELTNVARTNLCSHNYFGGNILLRKQLTDEINNCVQVIRGDGGSCTRIYIYDPSDSNKIINCMGYVMRMRDGKQVLTTLSKREVLDSLAKGQ
jgi:hypothetical protein